MLFPRYSIRTVLYLAVVVAIAAIVAGQAVQGAAWAIGATVGIASLAVVWLVFVAFYAIAAAFARVALARELRQPRPAYYPQLRRELAVEHEHPSTSVPHEETT